MWPSALTVVGLALAATWYVAPGGTGNGSTTQAPLARIQSAVDSAQPGDEIQVGAGVYREAVSIRGDGGISVTGTGTGEVVIDGQGAATPLAVLAPNVRLSHLVLQGGRGKNLFFSTDRNSDPTVCFPRAGDLELQSVVTRGEVLPSAGTCESGATSDDLMILCVSGRVIVRDSRLTARSCRASIWVKSVYFIQRPLLLERTVLSGARQMGVRLEKANGGVIRQNRFEPCCELAINGVSQPSAGVWLEDLSTVNSVAPSLELDHNSFQAAGAFGLRVLPSVAGATGEQLFFRHNTVVGASCAVRSDRTHVQLRGNLIVGPCALDLTDSSQADAGSSSSAAYDLVYGASSPYRSSGPPVEVKSAALLGDPRFVDADAGDFSLRPDSPAIDQGDPFYASEPGLDLLGHLVPLAASPDGGARADIGAIEYLLAPVARVAPARQTAQVGAEVLLDARESFASRGAQLVAFSWSQRQGPTGLALGSASTATFRATAPGTYQVQLIVNDSTSARSLPAVAVVEVVGEIAEPNVRSWGCAAGGGELAWLALLAWAVGVKACSGRGGWFRRRGSSPEPSCEPRR